MTPYVIDQSKRQEYFLFLVFFIVLSFLLGYFFGYQSGQSSREGTEISLEENQSLVNPSAEDGQPSKELTDDEKKDIGDKNSEQQKDTPDVKDKDEAKKQAGNIQKTQQNRPAPIKAVEKVTVSDNSTKKTVSRPQPAPKPKPKPQPKPQVIKSVIEKPIVSKTSQIPVPADSVKQLSASSIKKQKPEDTKTLTSKIENAPKANEPVRKSLYSEQLKQAQDPFEVQQADEEIPRPYSVQVGMFANQPNAENFVEILRQDGFDVYLGDFVSSDGSVKYNVRLGPYSDRGLARKKMDAYKQSYTTPAYIVISK